LGSRFISSVIAVAIASPYIISFAMVRSSYA
jgi:hypothetical protein